MTNTARAGPPNRMMNHLLRELAPELPRQPRVRADPSRERDQRAGPRDLGFVEREHPHPLSLLSCQKGQLFLSFQPF